MAEFSPEKRVVISTDPAALAESVASRLLSRVIKCTADGDVAHVALAGGRMASSVLSAVAAHPRRDRVDWARVHIWWTDERFIARADDERNEKQAHEALLHALPAATLHTIAAADDGLALDAAADRYRDELARYSQSDAVPWPSFDVCFLGVGPDGHIASLFPDRAEILVTDRAVVAVRDAPKPPPNRISVTRPVINSSKRVWLVLAGADKAAALGLALAGASYASVPAAGAKGRKRTVFFVDEAAAAQVPPELIDGEY